MELEWGYKSIVIPVVNTTYYTIKLRFNKATFGWMWLPSKVKVSTKNGYHTIQYVTTDLDEFIYIKDRIMEGQQDQMKYILNTWIDTKHRLEPKHAYNPNLIQV